MSNELDKQISERLHHYESVVDAEAIAEITAAGNQSLLSGLLLY